MKKKMKIFALIFIAALILPFGNIQAQEVQPEVLIVEQQVEEQTAPKPLETTIKQTVVPKVINPEITSVSETPTQESATATETVAVSAASTEVDLDENIMPKDLNISEPTLLPTSPYYPIKNIWRGIKSTLTFNPVKKAELKLQYANEKLIEAKKVSELKNESELAAKALESYGKEINGISKIIEKFSDKTKEKAEKLAEKIIDNSFKQQKLIDGIEKNLEPEQLNKVNQVRNEGLEGLGKTIANLVPQEQIQNKINAAIQNQTGSEFKDFKNLEILKSIEEKVPEQAREAIRQAQENTFNVMERKIQQMQEEEREKLGKYIENVGGNEVQHLEIINNIIEKASVISEGLKKAKEKTFEKIEQKMENLDEEQKKEFINHLEQGTMQNLRIIKEMENNLSSETVNMILETKNTAIDNFRKDFETSSSTAEEQEQYLEELEKNHDVKQLEVLKEVEKIIPQDKKEFFEEMKNKVVDEMKKEINQAKTQTQKSDVLDRLAGDTPEQIEVIKEFVPAPEIMNQILQKQTEKIMEKIQTMDDAEKIQQLKERINENTSIKQDLEKKMPNISREIENKLKEKIEEISKEKSAEQLEKAKREIDQVEKKLNELSANENFGEYLKKSAAPKHLEQAKKHLDEAKTAFEQEKYGHAFGQATSALNQISSAWKIIKEIELRHDVAQKRIETMEQNMEEIITNFSEPGNAPSGDNEVLNKEGEKTEEIELPFEQMNLSGEQIQKIKEETKILPKEIKQKLQDIPAEMILEATERIKEKINPSVTPLKKEVRKEEQKQEEKKEIPQTPAKVEPIKPEQTKSQPVPLPKKESNACIQVITPAMKDGVCREFPTPCDVPAGWQKVEKCQSSIESKVKTNEPLIPQKKSEQKSNVQPEPTVKKELQNKPMAKPEGSLGKPSLFEKVKDLLKQ